MPGDRHDRITVETERTLIVAHQRILRVMCPKCGSETDTVTNGIESSRTKGLESQKAEISSGVSHSPGTTSLFSRLWSLFRQAHLHRDLWD